MSGSREPSLRSKRTDWQESIWYLPYPRCLFRQIGLLTNLSFLPGANVNFDTCIDDKASAALFGTSHVGLALGIATEVSCKEWSGSANIL